MRQLQQRSCACAAGVRWAQLQDTWACPAASLADQLGDVHTYHTAVDTFREAAAAVGAATKHSCRRLLVSAGTDSTWCFEILPAAVAAGHNMHVRARSVCSGSSSGSSGAMNMRS